MTRILRSGFREFRLIRRFEAAHDAEIISFNCIESAMGFLRQFAQSHFDMMPLRNLFFSVSSEIDLSRVSNNELIERLAVKLVAGEVQVARMASPEPVQINASVAKKEVQSRPITEWTAPAPAKTSSSWLEIELLDEDGNLIHGEPYEIELPDGSRRTGKLN